MPLHLIWSALGNQGKEIWQCVLSGSCDFQLELRSAHLVNYPSKCFSSSIDMYTEKAMAPHSSTLAWKIPWTEEPGRLQSMGSLRVGHNWTTSLSLFFSCIGEGNGNPLQHSCLENPRDGGAWWAAVYVVAQSRTRLKRLSNSSSRHIYTIMCEIVSGKLLCNIGSPTCDDLEEWDGGREGGPRERGYMYS